MLFILFYCLYLLIPLSVVVKHWGKHVVKSFITKVHLHSIGIGKILYMPLIQALGFLPPRVQVA